MSNTSKLKISGSKYKDSEIAELLIGMHVKFKYEGWTKVYQVKVLRTSNSDSVVLHINPEITPYSGLKKFLSEEDPSVVIKKKRWRRT